MAQKFLHHNQKRAAEKLADVYLENNYAILMAQMQSGKTMSAIWTAILLGKKINKVYIISGDSQTYLQKQWMVDIQNLKSNGYGQDLTWHVCFRNNLQFIDSDIKNALFIWDESHTAQTSGQSLDHFYKRLQIQINGESSGLKKRGLYILSISATPISEITCNITQCQNKQMVFLKTPSLYRGVEYFYNNHFIQQSFPIEERNQLERLLTNHLHKGYFIMRIRNTRKFNMEQYIKPIAKEIGFKTIVCSSKRGADTNDLEFMTNEPNGPTLILIFGKFRMGQRIHKAYLTGMFEHSNSMKSDTALQGLLGRSCGYHKHNFFIYMPIHIIEKTIPEFLKFVKTRGKSGISNAMNTGSISPNSPVEYFPNTNGKEIFSNTNSVKPLTICTNLIEINYCSYGQFYECVY